jgi:hypothetical protein
MKSTERREDEMPADHQWLTWQSADGAQRRYFCGEEHYLAYRAQHPEESPDATAKPHRPVTTWPKRRTGPQ